MWQNRGQGSGQGAVRRYPSKIITELMELDSDASDPSHQSDSDDEFRQQASKQRQIQSKQGNNSIPALTTIRKQKQNMPMEANRARQIKYSCFRVNGEKLVQSGQYTSLNLEQASIIKDNNQILNSENDRLKEQRKQLNRRINDLDKQNKILKRQLNITKEELEIKDNYFGELEQKFNEQNRQYQQQKKRVQALQYQLAEQKQQLQQQRKKSKKGTKKQSQLSYYIEGNSRQNFDTGSNPNKKTHSNQNSQKAYSDVSAYIIKRVQQLRDRLMEQRMSKSVEDIIQEFMSEMVNINPITVGRTIAKSRSSCTPVRRNKHIAELQNPSIIRSTLFQDQAHPSITPTKPQPKQKSQQLRNLEKSLQKLRDMEKSYLTPTPNGPNMSAVSNAPNGIKDSYSSLDRSSLIGLDRSKSRRKKIFQ